MSARKRDGLDDFMDMQGIRRQSELTNSYVLLHSEHKAEQYIWKKS